MCPSGGQGLGAAVLAGVGRIPVVAVDLAAAWARPSEESAGQGTTYAVRFYDAYASTGGP